jgi:hypothetical protein
MISSTKSRLLAITELKKKERNQLSIQTLYTVTIKQKEHINLRQRKKCPYDISTSIDRRRHSIFVTVNFDYTK